MPATINEAFTSPFHKFNSGQQMEQTSASMVSTSSADIRNPEYQENYRVYNNATNYDMQYSTQQPQSYYALPQYAASQQPQPQPQHQRHPYAGKTDQHHSSELNHGASSDGCDMLVARIMSCPVCRQKLRAIMVEDHIQSQQKSSVPPQQSQQEQTGGSFNMPEIPGFLGNFIVGIALIFLIDRIVKLKLG